MKTWPIFSLPTSSKSSPRCPATWKRTSTNSAATASSKPAWPVCAGSMRLAMVCRAAAAAMRSTHIRPRRKHASDCEDYGQAVVYRGSIAQHAQAFVLDKHHRIEAGRVFPVCGNTFRMLKESRLAPHFDFIGDFSRHYGLFEGCGKALPFTRNAGANAGTNAADSAGTGSSDESCGCC
jgi:hypothetical protein